jgi:hypothetical protein
VPEVDPDQAAALRRLRAASVSSRSCGSSTTTARTRTTAHRGRRAGTIGRPVSVSLSAASCGGTRPAGAGSDTAATTRRSRRPTRMLGRSVPLQEPPAEEPAATALDRTAPLLPGLARVMQAEQGVRLGQADLQARDADQHREQPHDFAEGPSEGPAEGTVRPHSAPPILELVFENLSQLPRSFETSSWGPRARSSQAACGQQLALVRFGKVTDSG